MLWQGAMVALAQDLVDFRAKTKPPTAPPLRKAVSTFEANPSHRFHFVRTSGLENGGCGGGGGALGGVFSRLTKLSTIVL